MEKSLSDMSLQEVIGAALSKAREGQVNREQALVITKLDEAMMWCVRYQEVLKEAARRAGVGMSVRGHGQDGLLITDDLEQIKAEQAAQAAYEKSQKAGGDGQPTS